MMFLPQVPPAKVSPAAVYEVPFTMEGYLIVVEGKVNGKPAKLILDTGAGAGLYTPKSAEKLGLPILGQAMVGGGGEKMVPAKFTNARIELGGAVQDKQLGVILELPSGAKAEFDGIVGYPFLKNYVVQLDYIAKRVRFLDPKSFTPSPKAQQLPMTLRMNIPEIPGKIDGIEGRLRVDTGYSGTLTFTSPTVQKYGLTQKYNKRVETVLGQGVGGVTTGQVVRVQALELGALSVAGVVTGLSVDKSGALADAGTIALLGGEVLSRFTVTLDYPGKRLFLEKNTEFGKPFIFSRAGFSGIFEGEGYKVMTVVPNGPAAQAGIEKDDVILAMDGLPTKGMGLSRSREIFRREPGTQVPVRLRSASGAAREVVLILKEVL
jgi:predicted aspartyl protease